MRTSRPADRKQQIGLAAQRLFHQLGYNSVGIDQLAAEVGIGGPAIYRHYRGKQDLLYQILVVGLSRLQELADLVTKAAGSAPSPSVLATMARESLDRRGLAALWQREARYLTSEQQADVEQRLVTLHLTVENALFSRRDGLSELKAGAVLSVLWSPSFHTAALPRPAFDQLLVDIAWAVALAPLPPPQRRAVLHDRQTRSPQSRRGSRRELLLATASRLFAERGFASVSVSDIAEAAGTSAPSVYRQFASKTDLLTAALARAAEALHLSLAQVLVTSETADQAIRLIVSSYVDVMLKHMDIVQLLASELNHLPADEQEALRRTQREYVAEWLHPLAELRPELTPASRRVLVHAALTVLNDVLRAGRRHDPEQLRQPAVSLALAVLLPAEPPREP